MNTRGQMPCCAVILLLLAFLCTSPAASARTLVKDRLKRCQTIEHTAYTARWNSATLTPVWVAYTLTPEMVTREGVSRDGYGFAEDPAVRGMCASPMDYSRSGWDRGHMMPAADCKFSAAAMEESFLMTNVCPQCHELNDGAWLKLEQQVRFWCAHWYRTELHVVCGPVYSGRSRRIGKNGVAVPDAFFKVVCLRNSRTGHWQAVGFVFPNADCTEEYSSAAVSVDEVEEMTGLDFFPDFPEEEAMEAAVGRNWKF